MNRDYRDVCFNNQEFDGRYLHQLYRLRWQNYAQYLLMYLNVRSIVMQLCNSEPFVEFRISKIDVVVETLTMGEQFEDDRMLN